ncbi:MAG: stalk domain-containing protein [Defluviitaleaceae bacterium]|nr:stalk domain-containing protein [Defluviitaleaceae bacterium]
MKKYTYSFICIVLLCAIIFATPLFSLLGLPGGSHNIASPSAVVIDFATGEILFEKDAHSLRAPASMTKAMTAFVVYEEIEAGNLTLDTLIPVSTNAAMVSADISIQGAVLPIQAGSYVSVDTLLHLMMTLSSNGACIAVAEFISGCEDAFVQRMNESARAIGMTAYFNNVHGALLHYTTAYSIAILVREFITRYPDILRVTSATSFAFGGIVRNNTNLLMHSGDFYFTYADGFRTGTSREAGFCLASTAERDGHRVIAVVMGASSSQDRFSDSITLLEYGLIEIARRTADKNQRADSEPVTVIVDDNKVYFPDQQPFIIDGVTMVPVRGVFEKMGFTVGWDSQQRAAILSNQQLQIIIPAYGDVFSINGDIIIPEVPQQMINGRLMLPLRAIAEALGGIAYWDSNNRVAVIITNQDTKLY